MLAQLLDVLLELSLFIIIAIMAGALSSYFFITRYDSDIANIPKEQAPDEYSIRLDEIQDTLAKGGIESDKVKELMEQMEKRLAVYDQHEYLRNFFLPTELKVFQVMAEHLLEDGPVPYGEYLLYSGGWRNKNEIWEASGVPKKSIYGRNNILVRFTVLGLTKQRPSISKWGRQKFQYKLNAENLTVKDYVGVLRDSKIE